MTELIDRVTTDISGRVTGVQSAVLRRSLLGILARSEAGAVHMLYGFLEWAAKQAIIDTAEKEYLERWAAIWKVFRKAADYATGAVLLSGAVDSSVAAGTILQRQDGVQYRVLVDGVFTGSTLQLTIVAVEAGAAGDAPTGTPLFLLSPVAGVQSTGSVSADIEGGLDVETDPQLLSRLLKRIRQPPHGGASSDYQQWALEVPGVTRVWVYPLQMGAGTVTVLFVCDGETDIIPAPAKVAEVQAYINARRPVTAEVFVAAPIADSLSMSVKLSPNTAAVQAAVRAEVADLIARDSIPGSPILISRLREAVSIAAGESDNAVTSPTADIPHAAGHMAIPGTITFSSF
ncbi:baseplate J/gp47 family protein [Pseudomonas sp. NMI795_08]|uniref:baseplate J/gp47 family protein n=1 Tax=Pseudomonas sp. NMI795_08 TaxID=2903144 RepID=UPI001E3667D6|nr:baseplate J/gp47 family protein [Pseudomonas sp. NMI795_08]MCE1117461.1 baseplate J/gp47 family protein [Pseudomonas sp. NMI795_08]